MRTIYIVLTHTGTTLSRIIKGFTNDEFSHCSISLDLELKEMYSFGRLNPYNPFIGGFVHEYIDKGTYKRFYKTKTKIFSLKITEEQYERIRKNINRIEKNKENYKFNMIGLIGAGFNKRVKRKRAFYCAEFVKYLLEKVGIDTKLPTPVRPENFKDIENIEKVYEGFLKKYKAPKLNEKINLSQNIWKVYGKVDGQRT